MNKGVHALDPTLSSESQGKRIHPQMVLYQAEGEAWLYADADLTIRPPIVFCMAHRHRY